MYYEEKMIDGVLHCRTTPDGEWLPVANTQHRASHKQWDFIEQRASEGDGPAESCILELCDRVEALEAAQRPSPSPAVERVLDMQERIQEGTLTLSEALQEFGTPAPADSLVERVAEAIAHKGCFAPDETYGEEARAAIRVMAGELRAQCFVHAADWLDAQSEQ